MSQNTLTIEFETPDSESAYKIGILIVESIHHVLSGSRSGKWYPLPGNIYYDKNTPVKDRADNYHVKFTGAKTRGEIQGAAYQASAPGEAPAVRTGRLRQSFHMEVYPTASGTYIVKVLTNVIYAGDLHYGTEKVKPRPFADKALKRVMSEITGLLTVPIFKTIRGYV
jgi:hypothetical protein